VEAARVFSVAVRVHYLIVSADRQQIAHHRRGENGEIARRIIIAGEIRLDPPDITIFVEDIYAAWSSGGRTGCDVAPLWRDMNGRGACTKVVVSPSPRIWASRPYQI
jgi:hypothetical protein